MYNLTYHIDCVLWEKNHIASLDLLFFTIWGEINVLFFFYYNPIENVKHSSAANSRITANQNTSNNDGP